MNGQDKSIYDDPIFNIPYDIVSLPSEGQLYGGTIPAQIEVNYVTADDEDTIYSDAVDNVFNLLIADKIKDKSIDVNNLLLGDYNQILMFLRKTAFGNTYLTNTFDPDTNTFVKAPIEIDKLKRKPIGAPFNEKGEFEFILKNMNKKINFRLLTVGLSDYINVTAQNNKKANGITPYITTRLSTQITAVDGITEKPYIAKFAKVMNPDDRVEFMAYADSIAPGVDLHYEFESTIKKTKYTDKITLGIDFFYVSSPLSK